MMIKFWIYKRMLKEVQYDGAIEATTPAEALHQTEHIMMELNKTRKPRRTGYFTARLRNDEIVYIKVMLPKELVQK